MNATGTLDISMLSLSALQILALAGKTALTSAPSPPMRQDSLRPVAIIISFVDSESPNTTTLQRLTQIANDEAAAVHIRLVFYDLATSLLLPDTLLVLSIRLGPERASSSIDAKWLVPRALFAPRTLRTHFPLRIACGRAVAGGVSHPGAMNEEAVRQLHEDWYRKMLRGALECLIRET